MQETNLKFSFLIQIIIVCIFYGHTIDIFE